MHFGDEHLYSCTHTYTYTHDRKTGLFKCDAVGPSLPKDPGKLLKTAQQDEIFQIPGEVELKSIGICLKGEKCS